MGQDRIGRKEFLPEPYSREYVYEWLEKCPYDSIVHLVVCLNALEEGKQPPEKHVMFLSPFLRKMLAEKWYEKTIERQLKIYFPEVFASREEDKQEKQENIPATEVENEKDQTKDAYKDKETKADYGDSKDGSENANKEATADQTQEEGYDETQQDTEETNVISQVVKKSVPKEDPFAKERTFLEWIEFLLSKHPVTEKVDKEKEEQSSDDNSNQINQIKQMLNELSPKKQRIKQGKSLIVSERLATVYEQQGQWKDALEIYKALTLQKPEKKEYFERKIEELKRKIRE